MLESAFSWDCGPIAIRYPRGRGGEGEDLKAPITMLKRGEAREISSGSRGAIFAIGSAVPLAREAARQLRASGYSPQVIDARFVKPLDLQLLSWAEQAGFVVTVEENVLAGGFGSAVLELFAQHDVFVPTRCIALPDRFVEHGPATLLREASGLSVEKIKAAFLQLEQKK